MLPSKELESLLGEAFDRLCGSQPDPSDRWEFVFHMSDWIDDAKEFSSVVQDPEKWNATRAARFVFGYVQHVGPHLNRAFELLQAAQGRRNQGGTLPDR